MKKVKLTTQTIFFCRACPVPLKIRKSKWYEFSLDIFMSGSKKHFLICCSWDHCDIKHHLLMRTMRKTESKLVSAHINAVLRTALKKKEELQQQEKKKLYYYLLYSSLSLHWGAASRCRFDLNLTKKKNFDSHPVGSESGRTHSSLLFNFMN